MKYIITIIGWIICNLLATISCLIYFPLRYLFYFLWNFKLKEITFKFYASDNMGMVRRGEVGTYRTIFHFLWSIKNFKQQLKKA